MTRIFDALKKSQRVHEPAMIPAPVLHPVRPASIVRQPVERLDIVPLSAVAPFDEGVQREMSALRVHLEGALPARSPRSLVLLSAREGEGTSTVTMQLAQALAQSGQRVLVVDANAARPSPLLEAGRAPSGKSPERGTLHMLPLTERLQRSGPMSPVAVRDLLDVSGAGYDWLLIDSPPLLESPDAAPLAAQFDGAVIVVRAGRTKRPVLIRASDLLRRSQANVLGTILNRRRLEIPDFLYRRI